jgi:ABC-type dipeptide/oligopeptide/nickel transport system permease subunit
MKTRHNPGGARTWALTWLLVMGAVLVWDAVFLNHPAMIRIQSAVVNSFLCGIGVVAIALTAGWVLGITIDAAEAKRSTRTYLVLVFLVNMIRSIPQIVGILLGYTMLTALVVADVLRSSAAQLLSMSAVVSVFIIPEVVDLMRERLRFYRTKDFVDAMRCCGISEWRIVNREILWRNSRAHLMHKAISVFGISLFLQCSIDFVVSVGLSASVSASNFPVTLGNVLATLDSKQDILAIANVLTEPSYVAALLTTHLQGITVAFVIVFSLLCVYRIANGVVERYGIA